MQQLPVSSLLQSMRSTSACTTTQSKRPSRFDCRATAGVWCFWAFHLEFCLDPKHRLCFSNAADTRFGWRLSFRRSVRPLSQLTRPTFGLWTLIIAVLHPRSKRDTEQFSPAILLYFICQIPCYLWPFYVINSLRLPCHCDRLSFSQFRLRFYRQFWWIVLQISSRPSQSFAWLLVHSGAISSFNDRYSFSRELWRCFWRKQ